MSLTLHFHPLSSFCWKALVGLYELQVPFEKHLVDLSNAAARAAFAGLWPAGRFRLPGRRRRPVKRPFKGRSCRCPAGGERARCDFAGTRSTPR